MVVLCNFNWPVKSQHIIIVLRWFINFAHSPKYNLPSFGVNYFAKNFSLQN